MSPLTSGGGGGLLNLSFISTELLPFSSWALHLYLASDNFASIMLCHIYNVRLLSGAI